MGSSRLSAVDRAVAGLARAIELLRYYEKARADLESPSYTWEPEIRPGDRERDKKRRRALYDLNLRDAQRGVGLWEKQVASAEAARVKREARARERK